MVESFLMTAETNPHRWRIALAFALVYVLWGSTYLAMRIVVQHVPPAVMGATRFLISGTLMLGWCLASGRKIAVTRKDLVRLAAIGVLLLVTGNVGVAWGEKYVASGLAALVVAVVPLWVALIELTILKTERLARRGLAGLALGIAGLAILLWPRLTDNSLLSHKELGGVAILIFASLSWACGSITSRRSHLSIGPFAATGWEMTLAGLVNLALALAMGDFSRTTWSTSGYLSIAYLVTGGSLIGFTAYIWLLEHVPTSKVATYAYVNPVVAVLLGWLILHEKVDGYVLAGTAVIICGVALVTISKIKITPAASGALLAGEATDEPEVTACGAD